MSSIFRIIETFFFISLGITFILVLLLVFHFKMRLLSLEEKHDTTLEIINNIVGELQYIKKSGINDNDIKKVNMIVEPHYESNGDNGYIETVQSRFENKVYVSEEEESDDESCGDSDVEGSNDSDDECSDDECSDDECSVGGVDAVERKIVKINSDVEVPTIDVVVTKEGHDDHQECDDEYSSEDDLFESSEQDVDSVDMIKRYEATIVEVNIESPEIDVSNEEGDDIIVDSNIDDYRKLNVQSLKSIAISKGLSTDPSKLKKKELLSLLA